MGFLDKAKVAAGQAAAKAKEGVEELQTRRELSQAQADLGKVTFELVESGALQHDRLTAGVQRIRELTDKLEAEGSESAAADAPAGDDATAG